MSNTKGMDVISEDKIKEQYATEKVQTDHDHKNPTSGAMSGHVIANLQVLQRKLQQFKWTVSGSTGVNDSRLFGSIQETANQFVDELVSVMADNGQTFPTTTAEISEYTMLEENPAWKYDTADMMVDSLVNDFDTCELFVPRAIALAQKESYQALIAVLTKLSGWNRHQIRILQQRLDRPLDSGRPLLEEES